LVDDLPRVPGLPLRLSRSVRSEIQKASRQPALIVYLLLVAAVAGLAGPISYGNAKEKEAEAHAKPRVTHTFGEPAPAEPSDPTSTEARGANGFLVLAVSLRYGLMLSAVLILLHSAALLAGEMSGGTLRHVLVRPVTRTDVLVGKALVVFLLAMLLVFVTTAVSGGLGLVFGGYGDLLDVQYGTVDRSAPALWANTIRAIAVAPAALFAVGAFGLFFSALFENPAAAVTAAVLAGVALVAANFWLTPEVAGYAFLTWVDRPAGVLVSLARGRSELDLGAGATRPALLIPVASGFLFLLAARIIFCRRDIHA